MKKLLLLTVTLVLILTGFFPDARADGVDRHNIRFPVTVNSYTWNFFHAEEGNDGAVVFSSDPLGEHYGFPDAYSTGCSVWCAVQSQEVTAWGSSWLPQQGTIEYLPANVTDGSRSTVWSEGVPGYGIGEFVELGYRYNEPSQEYPQQFDFETICIVNGYAQNAKKWAANSRVKAMDVYVNENRLFRFNLQDTIEPQYFDISDYGLRAWAGEQTIFRFVITDVYPGDLYDDTCITGIELEFWPPNH